MTKIRTQPGAQYKKGGFGQFQQQIQQAQQPVFQGYNTANNNTVPFANVQYHHQPVQQAQQAPVGSLFGQAQQAPVAPLFGGNASNATSAFGSTFGGPTFGLFGSSTIPNVSNTAQPAAAETAAAEDDAISTFEEIPCPTSEPTTVVTESPLSVSYAVEGE